MLVAEVNNLVFGAYVSLACDFAYLRQYSGGNRDGNRGDKGCLKMGKASLYQVAILAITALVPIYRPSKTELVKPIATTVTRYPDEPRRFHF